MEKKKFSLRVIAGAAALSVTTAFIGPGPAGAETVQGLGTSTASHSLLSVQLGSLLDLGLLTDTARSTIDEALAPKGAFSKLVPLSVKSSVLPALEGLAAALPTFESRTPGGQGDVSGSAIDFSQGGSLLGLPLGLVGGILGGQLVPNHLTSALDNTGARSGLDAALARLSILSGVLKVNSVSNKLSTAAALPEANGTRALSVDAISLLNLGDLLQGLGLGLPNLDLSIVSNLLGTLNLPLTLLPGSTSLLSSVTTLLGDITSITGVVGTQTDLLDDVVNQVPAVNNLLGGLPTALIPLSGGTSLVPIQNLNLPLGTVENLLDTLQGTLTNLLGNALNLLGNLPLLKLDGANIGVTTKATDTVANSVADVAAQLGGLSVLGIQIPGLDLLSIGQLVNNVTGLIGNVLAVVDPSLRDLIKVGVLDKATSVTSSGGYVNALASLNLLSVDVNPPALLSNLVRSLTGNSGLSALGLLGQAGVASPQSVLPAVGGGILNLGGLLNIPATVGALAQGLHVKVGALQSASQFKLASAPAPAATAAPVASPTLPRTGADTGPLGFLAAGMAVLALGVRRWSRRTQLD